MTHKIIELHNNTLKVFEDGKVLVKRFNREEFYEKKSINYKGYLRLQLNNKKKQKNYFIHRLVAFAFLNLDLENPVQVIDHQDRDKLNNNLSNLRIVTQQQNQFNRNAKGYSRHRGKWQSQIKLDGKKIHLGLFETEEDASKAYQDAKLVYHII
tara:strand:- start:38 stop:499 length:462 start_codon:yes stop_codon:yes gene_type:complete